MKIGQSTYMKTFNITFQKWDNTTIPIALQRAGMTKLYIQALFNQNEINIINIDSRINSAEQDCEEICKTMYPNCQYNVVEQLTGPFIINDDWTIETEKDLYEYNLYEAYR